LRDKKRTEKQLRKEITKVNKLKIYGAAKVALARGIRVTIVSRCLAYRDGLAVRLFPIEYPLPQGESVQAGEPVAATGFAVPGEPFSRAAAAAAIRAGVKTRRVLG